ncbi:hypothetical protein MUP77_03385 [Candidatus Bathyarchaeota archaeon]|nr:hypothetical protein [Candidatus Bathyarchaeota archaeon]
MGLHRCSKCEHLWTIINETDLKIIKCPRCGNEEENPDYTSNQTDETA